MKSEYIIRNSKDNNEIEKESDNYEKLQKLFLAKNKINKNFWEKHNPNIEIISGDVNKKDTNFNDLLNSIEIEKHKLLKDIQTLTIGEICFAALSTQGISDDQFSYVVTHVTESSTKIPFLFPGEVLNIGFPGLPYVINQQNCRKLFNSLNVYSSLPNDTLVYPIKNSTLSNMEILKKIDPENFFVDDKLKWAMDMQKNNECAVGSRMIEERFYNPAFKLDDEINRKILGENNSINVKFENLIKLKEMIDGQINENTKI